MCSQVLAPIEPPACERAPRPLEALEREICELAAHLAAATCRWLELLGEFDDRLGWAEWGVRSCAHWLSWRCSIGLCAAREHVRVARRLRELSLVRQAFAAGELSYCKVRAITRIATATTESDLVELARHATGAQLEKVVRGYRGAMSATLSAANVAHHNRSLRYAWEQDGSLRIEGRLAAEDGALLIEALRAAGSEMFAESPAEPEAAREPVGARRADALVQMARAALATPAGDRRDGDPCEVVVHVDAATLTADTVQERAELKGGPAVAPETVRRLGCDAAVVAIVERDGRPLSVGRRRRTIPPALRRALRARDDGCAFPGCDHTRFLHAHHIHHWARGGPTSLENLVQLCSHHHRLVHEGGYRVQRAGPDQIRFRRPDGRPIPAGPTHPRLGGPRLEHQPWARALRIDDRTCMPRSAGQSLDYGIAVEGLLLRTLRDRGG
jgi:hypothetical protein